MVLLFFGLFISRKMDIIGEALKNIDHIFQKRRSILLCEIMLCIFAQLRFKFLSQDTRIVEEILDDEEEIPSYQNQRDPEDNDNVASDDDEGPQPLLRSIDESLRNSNPSPSHRRKTKHKRDYSPVVDVIPQKVPKIDFFLTLQIHHLLLTFGAPNKI